MQIISVNRNYWTRLYGAKSSLDLPFLMGPLAHIFLDLSVNSSVNVSLTH